MARGVLNEVCSVREEFCSRLESIFVLISIADGKVPIEVSCMMMPEPAVVGRITPRLYCAACGEGRIATALQYKQLNSMFDCRTCDQGYSSKGFHLPAASSVPHI